MTKKRKFRRADYEATEKTQITLGEALPEEHLARFIVSVVALLDLSEIYERYSSRGGMPYAPEVLLGLLLYGYATGTFSSRKLERATYESIPFRYIAGNMHPDHDTLNQFRKDNLQTLKQLFVQVLVLAYVLGYVKLGNISIDGSKIHADASKSKAVSYGRILSMEKRLQQEIEALFALAEKADSEPSDDFDIDNEIGRRRTKLTNLAQAKALDLSDAGFLFKQNYSILGTDDINQIANSDIIIITAGMPRKPGMKREELLQKNSQIIKGICKKIKTLSPKSIIIVVTNPLDAMTYTVIKETNFSAERVLGMGLTLDQSRLANLIAQTLGISVTDVQPCIIGSHGEGMLPLSRYTKIQGRSLDSCLKPDEIKELFQRTVKRGAEIVSVLGNGSAYFAPSAAISELVKTIIRDEKRNLPVSVYLNGEYGLRDLCIGLPCCLGKKGIEKIIKLELDTQEKEALIKSADSIRKQISLLDAQAYTEVKT